MKIIYMLFFLLSTSLFADVDEGMNRQYSLFGKKKENKFGLKKNKNTINIHYLQEGKDNSFRLGKAASKEKRIRSEIVYNTRVNENEVEYYSYEYTDDKSDFLLKTK